MIGLCAFDKMLQNWSEYRNEDHYDDEDDSQYIISNKSSYDIDDKIILNHSNETHGNESKSNYKNKTNLPETSTKPTFITKKEVGQKRDRSKEKDKGSRKNIKLNRYKSNFFRDSHRKIYEMIEQTEYYKNHHKNINEIKNYIYIKQRASENLSLLEYTLKEVLSMDDEENKEIIDAIYYTNDSPSLIRFLDKKVKELMLFYSDNDIVIEEDYHLYLRNSYKNLIQKMKDKEKKSESYLNSFREYANNIEQVFISMNAHTKTKSK